jgi:hypothetical protein
MKNYRFLGEEAEVLGNRLDAARRAFAESKTKWSKKYWKQVVDRLVFQWRQLPVLHDGDAQVTIIPRWTIDYDFYETSQEGGLHDGFVERIFDSFKLDANLDASWHRNREARLARAQF